MAGRITVKDGIHEGVAVGPNLQGQSPGWRIDQAGYNGSGWGENIAAGYGSPHFKIDGTRGQDTLTPSSAYLSRDKKTVFVGLPGMQPVMQMRVGWSLKTAAGAAFNHAAYLTPY